MNIMELVTKRNLLADQCAALTTVIEMFRGVAPLEACPTNVRPWEPTLLPPPEDEQEAAAVEPRRSKPRGRPGKAPPKAGGERYLKSAAMWQAIGNLGDEFTAEEIVERGRLQEEPVRVAKNCYTWVKKGWLVVKSKGRPHNPTIYRRGPAFRELAKRFDAKTAKFHMEQAAPQKETAPEPVKKPNSNHPTAEQRVSPQIVALESLFAGLSGSHPAAAIISMVRQHWPELVGSDAKCSDLRVRLIDLAAAGKIRRIGTGSGAHYSAVPAGTSTGAAPEQELNIRVPRDPEVAS